MRGMQRNRFANPSRDGRAVVARWLGSFGLTVGLLLAAGCGLPPLAKHTVAFNAATKVVIDRSEDAYTTANRLHHEVAVQEAVSSYGPTWTPETPLKPLLTPEQLDARIKVLEALKAYAATLVDLTSGKPPKDLTGSLSGVGTNLQGLNQTVSTDFAPALPVMSTGAANGVSTAVLALAEYLIDSKTKQSLATVTAKMNPSITTLCELINSDVTVLRRQADVDYGNLITSENQLLLTQTGGDPFVRRDQIAKLIGLAEQKRANDLLLQKLQDALHTLDLTHQALADAAQNNNPESIKQKIADLEAAGQSLSTFYNSLPTT